MTVNELAVLDKCTKNVAIYRDVAGLEIGAMRAHRVYNADKTATAVRNEIGKVIIDLERPPLERSPDHVSLSV